jgi:hypothetical protein
MTEKLIEPKRTKPKPVVFATAAPKRVIAETAPPKFTPCRQCGNPGGCTRANRCVKGFK